MADPLGVVVASLVDLPCKECGLVMGGVNGNVGFKKGWCSKCYNMNYYRNKKRKMKEDAHLLVSLASIDDTEDAKHNTTATCNDLVMKLKKDGFVLLESTNQNGELRKLLLEIIERSLLGCVESNSTISGM